MDDLISRQQAIDTAVTFVRRTLLDSKPIDVKMSSDYIFVNLVEPMRKLPTAQPEVETQMSLADCISRQQAIDALNEYFARIGKLKRRGLTKGEKAISLDTVGVIKTMPSAQPERTCVNCGRTANNGGWYADGGTRCPIEEHYALPKDGYCHLWEKRNVTDDDYPERREE